MANEAIVVQPNQFLRVEGAAALAVALWAYVTLDGPLWLLAVVALAPDASVVGYLAGPRVGSLSYNVAHTYTLPLALAAVGVLTGTRLAVLVAAVRAAHVGADRMFGFGLKFESGFEDTHLSTQRPPIEALADAA